MEQELGKIAKQGLRILGPNCFGIYCPESGLTILPGQNFSRETGPVGFLSRAAAFAQTSARPPKDWASVSAKWSATAMAAM